jgi:SAM-dependent methyltransferase
MEVDPVAPSGPAAGGFAAAAPGHRRSRPAYERQVIGFLKELVPTGGLVLDVGAGTGVLTGQLHRAGLRVIAVESTADGVRQLALALPSVPVLSARSDALAVRDACIDLLVVAGDHDRAAPVWDEALRVLAPGATLALVRPAATRPEAVWQLDGFAGASLRSEVDTEVRTWTRS